MLHFFIEAFVVGKLDSLMLQSYQNVILWANGFLSIYVWRILSTQIENKLEGKLEETMVYICCKAEKADHNLLSIKLILFLFLNESDKMVN